MEMVHLFIHVIHIVKHKQMNLIHLKLMVYL